jgi:hypothetical protein
MIHRLNLTVLFENLIVILEWHQLFYRNVYKPKTTQTDVAVKKLPQRPARSCVICSLFSGMSEKLSYLLT